MIREGYQLYQMKSSPETDAYIFKPYAAVISMRYFPNVSDYDMVYDTPLRTAEDIRSIRIRIEKMQRKTGRFRAVNVGDVIAVYRSERTYCYYVESTGFVLLNDFFGQSGSSGSSLTPNTEDYTISGKNGLWRVVDTLQYENTMFFLMEHQVLKKQAACIILDAHGSVVDDEVSGDFDDSAVEKIRRFLHPELPKAPPIKHKRPPKELWQKYYENGEYERHGSHEVGDEENYNQIDGTNNNRKRWIPPKERKSVRKRLREKQALLHGKKETARILEKK